MGSRLRGNDTLVEVEAVALMLAPPLLSSPLATDHKTPPMNSRLILASAFILSLALPQAACAAAPPASAPAATPPATTADQEQLLAAERARLQAARAELAAQAAASATPPAAVRATPTAARTAPGNQPAQPAPVSPDVAGAPAVPAPAGSSAPAPDAGAAGAPPQSAPATAARPPAQPPVTIGAPGPVGGPSAGSLLQTILALTFVLALLFGLAWFMKRFGPKAAGGSAHLRIVGSLNLGGRERLMVVEVGNQWIVVGASPGRVNALATMPKQEGAEQSATLAGHMPAASSFGEWLKQTIDKRNGK
jgi:flagellar protein FliO/FliZ